MARGRALAIAVWRRAEPLVTAFITGGARFIGSNLGDRLLRDGHSVVAYDDLSTGECRFVEEARLSDHSPPTEDDTLDLTALPPVSGRVLKHLRTCE